MSKDPYTCSPQCHDSPLLLSCITGHIPLWHVLHEDGQGSSRRGPAGSYELLHYALMLQVLQQLDLALQSTHLRKGPSGH